MNKKETILTEAKRLFGDNGYLGFTLKQLAQACEMTPPALYYFYSSKADLFHDCLLSEMEIRKECTERCMAQSTSLADFARALAYGAIEVCGESHFRTGRAMEEIIHLPEAMQQELRTAWDRLLIDPVVNFLDRVLPNTASPINRRLLATFIINIATFSAAKEQEFSLEDLAALFVAVAQGLSCTPTPTAG